MKNKLKSYLGKALIFLSLFSLFNCQNNDNELINQEESLLITTTSKEKAQNIFNSFLNNKKFKSKGNNSFKIEPLWNSFNQKNIGFKNALLSSVEIQTNTKNNLISKLVFLNVEDKVLRVIESKHIIDEKDKIINKGYVYYHNLNGKFIVGYEIENGIYTKRIIKNKNSNKNNKSIAFRTDCNEDLDPNSEFCNSTLEGFEIVVKKSGTATREASPIFFIFGGRVGINSAMEDYYYLIEGFGEGGGPGRNTDNNRNDDKVFNKLEGKADCAYKKLLSTGVANPHNMIIDLFIDFGENNFLDRDLTFKMSSDLPDNVGGKTVYYGDGKYGILINENLMNTLSSIEVSAILVHEMAHAFLGKHYNDLNSSFSVLYKRYINDTGLKNYSHDIMKDYYINRMASVLQNYDNSILSSFDDLKF
jgi:hypothetical protein